MGESETGIPAILLEINIIGGRKMKRESTRMVHVSFDLVDHFVPRIPKERIRGKNATEDNTIPRICVAPSIMEALNAIPCSGDVIRNMQKLDLPVILHAYYMHSDEFQKPTKELVPDVELTNEHWLCTEPERVLRKDFLLCDPILRVCTDVNGKCVTGIFGGTVKPTKYQDNTDHLCKMFGIDKRKIPENVSFRDLMFHLGPTFIEKKEEAYSHQKESISK